MTIISPPDVSKLGPRRPNFSRVSRVRRPSRTRRRRPLRWIVLGVVVVWLIVAGVMLALGLLQANRGIDRVHEAEAHLTASDLVTQAPVQPLAAARKDFDSSSSLLHSPVLTPLEVLPVLGRQLRAVRDLSVAAAGVSRIGTTAVRQVGAVIHVPHPAGPERVATLQHLATLAAATDASLSHIHLGPSDALLSPLASKRAQFADQLAEMRGRLSHAAVVARTLATILQGPKTYLVMMANNAEMRAGSGEFLELGVLTSRDGHLHLSDVSPSPSMNLPPGKVPVTGDLEARWGWLKPGVDWRNLGVTPQFGVNGALAGRMWQAATGQQVDGVLAIDVEALHQLLTVTGPVALDAGKVVSADNVVSFVTHDQYAGLTGSSDSSQNLARQDELGTLARSVLGALEGQSLDLRALAGAMTASTSGRHVLLWSADPSAESAWVQGGVAGNLPANSVMANVINRGANKLDPYLFVHAALHVTRHRQKTDVTLSVDLANRTPGGLSQYIAGPNPSLGTAYGEYVGVLALNLPGAARDLHVAGNPQLVAKGAEGRDWVLATPVDVKAGAIQRVVVGFTVPGAHGGIRVDPSARMPPVEWQFARGTSTDASPFTISW